VGPPFFFEGGPARGTSMDGGGPAHYMLWCGNCATATINLGLCEINT